MIFKSHVFDEPMLEFGDGGQHWDPRQGLREFGPLQPRTGDVLRVGVIGTEDTVGGFTEFLAETERGIDSENKQLINLNPDFPGLGNQNPFRCKFEVPDGATATLSRRQVNEIRGMVSRDNQDERRIASPEMLLKGDLLPHQKCSRPGLTGEGRYEADQHGDA